VTGDRSAAEGRAGARGTAARGGLARWLRHLWIGELHVRRAFPREALLRIEQAIADGERRHRAELRFAIESSLDARELRRRVTARERAVDVFSQFRVWDTEEDNGVLVYVLWADHAVEIVADRGAVRRIDAAVWQQACARLATACRDGRGPEGALAAIALLDDALAAAFPVDPDARANPDELPNAPIMLG
jgi:hypothetical protein